MKILKRSEKNKKWKKVFQHSYKNEGELQDLLYEDPSIIPVQEISEERKEIKIAIKEFGLPGAGSSDIVGIDEDGNITIIETKLAINPDIKRKVIGQILEYAAFLWRKTYEQFDEVVQSKKNKPLLDLMADLVEDENWSEEEFRREISNNLHEGDFSLVIVVDDIDDSLKRILEFVNSKSFSGPQIYAFVARYYKDKKGEEMIVPQFYGASIKETESREAATSKRKQWDEESFFEQVKEKAGKNREKIIKLYNYFKKEADEINWGTGIVNGSFSPLFYDLCKTISPLTFYSDGHILIKFNWLLERVSREDVTNNVKEFINILKNETDIKITADYFNETGNITVEELNNNFNVIFKAIKDMVSKIKN